MDWNERRLELTAISDGLRDSVRRLNKVVCGGKETPTHPNCSWILRPEEPLQKVWIPSCLVCNWTGPCVLGEEPTELVRCPVCTGMLSSSTARMTNPKVRLPSECSQGTVVTEEGQVEPDIPAYDYIGPTPLQGAKQEGYTIQNPDGYGIMHVLDESDAGRWVSLLNIAYSRGFEAQKILTEKLVKEGQEQILQEFAEYALTPALVSNTIKGFKEFRIA